MVHFPAAALCLLALPMLIASQFHSSQRLQNSQPRNGAGQDPNNGLEERPKPFDLDKDIAPIRVAQEMVEAVHAAISPFGSDASLVVRITVLMANAFFDAIAPYHPTAVGIYSSLGRRPHYERTNHNKNIAVFYCSLRVLGNAIPDQQLRFIDLLHQVGLNPIDEHESTADAIGIGNICGRMINEFRNNDGMNSRGDIGGNVSVYNRKPFRDYTNYKPVNPYDKIVDPRRWQPAVNDVNGVFKIQKYVTPQHGFTKAYSYGDVNRFKAKPHGRLLEGPNGKGLYKKTTDEVIAISAALTDEQKMAAEFFDNKLKSLGYAFFGTVEARNLLYDEVVFIGLVTTIAEFDTTIAIWNEKTRWDAVRPFTAIQYLYGDSLLTAYGGKGRGTVNDIPATTWNSYIPVGDHPEYPSTTAAICAAAAEASRNWLGEDNTLLKPVPFAQGNSRHKFRISPARNITLNLDTWTEFEWTCGLSRLWGGVHFVDAIEEGNRIGNEIGRLGFEFVRSHVYPLGRSIAPIRPVQPAVQILPLRTEPQYLAPFHYPHIPKLLSHTRALF